MGGSHKNNAAPVLALVLLVPLPASQHERALAGWASLTLNTPRPAPVDVADRKLDDPKTTARARIIEREGGALDPHFTPRLSLSMSIWAFLAA